MPKLMTTKELIKQPKGTLFSFAPDQTLDFRTSTLCCSGELVKVEKRTVRDLFTRHRTIIFTQITPVLLPGITGMLPGRVIKLRSKNSGKFLVWSPDGLASIHMALLDEAREILNEFLPPLDAGGESKKAPEPSLN